MGLVGAWLQLAVLSREYTGFRDITPTMESQMETERDMETEGSYIAYIALDRGQYCST